jgi:hypothetical protein
MVCAGILKFWSNEQIQGTRSHDKTIRQEDQTPRSMSRISFWFCTWQQNEPLKEKISLEENPQFLARTRG